MEQLKRIPSAFVALFVLCVLPLSVKYGQQTARHREYTEYREHRTQPILRSQLAPEQQTQTQQENDLTSNDSDKWIRWGVYVNGMIALATLIIAVFAVLQARAANLNAEGLVNSERAWIFVDIGETPEVRPDPARLQILWIVPVVRNVGRTPARIVEVSARQQQVANGTALSPEPEYQGKNPVNALLPPGAVFAPCNVGIDLSEFQDCRDGRRALYVYGYVIYSDLAKKRRETRFCYRWTTQHGFSPNPSGFYVDPGVPQDYTQCD